MVEIIAEDEVVAIDGLLGSEAESDAILVAGLGVRWEGEVGRCWRGVEGEASVVLWFVRVRVGGRAGVEGEEGGTTCTLTFRSTLMRSESMDTGVEVLTGTILCFLTSYSEPAVTWRT